MTTQPAPPRREPGKASSSQVAPSAAGPDAEHADQIEGRVRRAGEAGHEDQRAFGEQEVPEEARRTAASPNQAPKGKGDDVRDQDGGEQARFADDTTGGDDRRGGGRARKGGHDDGEIGAPQGGPERRIAQLNVQL